MVLVSEGCAVTQKGETVTYQNYYRKDIKTPVQPHSSSTTYVSPFFNKGEVAVSGSFTTSGTNYNNPKDSYTDEDGKSKFEKINLYSGLAQYALNDKWSIFAEYSGGNDENVTSIKRFTTTQYEVEDNSLAWILNTTIYLSTFGTVKTNIDGTNYDIFSTTINPEIDVKRAYSYWFTTLGSSLKIGKFENNDVGLSLSSGIGLGGADLLGTMRAKDDKIYLNIRDASPLTYGNHKNKHINLFLQLNYGYKINDFFELGLANRVSFHTNTIKTQLIIPVASKTIEYSDSYETLLIQPSIGFTVGKGFLKGGIEFAPVIPVINPTKEKFNTTLLSFSIKATIPTNKDIDNIAKISH